MPQDDRRDTFNPHQHLNEPNVAGSGPTTGPVEHEVQRRVRDKSGHDHTASRGQGLANPGSGAYDEKVGEEPEQPKPAPKAPEEAKPAPKSGDKK
jgi:hypothetical protein